MTDTEILDSLEQIVSSEQTWRDVILCWDHEDGYFAGLVERGDCNFHQVLDDEVEEKRKNLRTCLQAAIRSFKLLPNKILF